MQPAMQDAPMQPEVIALRGAPGVGKSSLRNHLQRLFPRGAFIEVDALREMCFNQNWTDAFPHELMIKCGAYLAEKLISEGGYSPVFVVDTFSKGKLRGFVNATSRPLMIISLYCTSEMLAKRVELRHPTQFKDLNACLVLNEEAKQKEFQNEFLIDTTYMTPEEIARQICKIVGHHFSIAMFEDESN